MKGHIYLMTAKIPSSGIKKFYEYESNVLPLLEEYGGRLERRLRSADMLFEVHLVWFPSIHAFYSYRNDPKREQYSHLLSESGAVIDVVEIFDFVE